MTCTTPLATKTLGVTTLALFTNISLPSTVIVRLPPFMAVTVSFLRVEL